MQHRNILILGATGSIGKQALRIIARYPQYFRVKGLTACSNIQTLAELCTQHQAERAWLLNNPKYPGVSDFPCPLYGDNASLESYIANEDIDTVLIAITGAAALLPTWAAVHAGKRLILANKEVIVIAGRLLLAAARQSGAEILPVDSEHNAVFQCLPKGYLASTTLSTDYGIERIILTASGGPFLHTPIAALKQVTPQMACAHPCWDMGAKISVDSATMMNKGLEYIEACHLFRLAAEQVEVVVQPQSMVHALVVYCDGSTLAQISHPDMQTPLAHALGYPQRLSLPSGKLDFSQPLTLQFQPPDYARFPCLRLAQQVARGADTDAVVLNAANEIAVAAFLTMRIAFTDIAALVTAALGHFPSAALENIATIQELDTAARRFTHQQIASCKP